MPLRRRATRIVELVGFAGAADATHGRPALFERQEAAVDAAKFWAAAIDGAPWIRIVLHLIGAGGRWGQDTAARRSFFLLKGHVGYSPKADIARCLNGWHLSCYDA
jgi:hypothetical protein